MRVFFYSDIIIIFFSCNVNKWLSFNTISLDIFNRVPVIENKTSGHLPRHSGEKTSVKTLRYMPGRVRLCIQGLKKNLVCTYWDLCGH